MVIKIKLNSDFKFPVFLNKLETIGYIKKIDSF
jgi:hypothetical protein